MEESLVLDHGAESHDLLYAGAVVPGTVEEDDLPAIGQVRDVALEVPLAGFPLARLIQGDDPCATGVEPFRETLDGAAFARRVPALADHHHAGPGVLDPALQLQQFDLQDPLRPLVLRPPDLPVVGVVLAPGPDRRSGSVQQHRLLRPCRVHAQTREQPRLGQRAALFFVHVLRVPATRS